MIDKKELEKKIIVKSKRNILRIIDICFWSLIVISFLFIAKEAFAEIDEFGGWEEVKAQFSTIEIIIKFAVFFFIGILFENFVLIIVYISIKLAIKKYASERLSSVDFKKYEGYFRDILKSYSPAELSYIDNFEISYENDLVATLLSLKLKGAITFNENSGEITVINNTIENISSNERYVLSCINDGKVYGFNDGMFKSTVLADSVKNGLLEDRSDKKGSFSKKFKIVAIAIVVLIVSIILLMVTITGNNPDEDIGFLVLLLAFACFLLFYLPVGFIVYGFTYIIKSVSNQYVRSKKGELINEKIEGLKNYLSDYSILDSREKESVTVWEDYLLYSVIFKQNNNIVRDIINKYCKMN